MGKSKILYVTQSIEPFLDEDGIASLVRKLSQGSNELGHEIRVFMPKFGVVNERRHQLHEVIRLSGMNLIIDDADHPLIIKVASIPQARMQVYFIDNDELFKRKRIFYDTDLKFFDDNDDRALFFGRGVFETVKKLGWSPDIIHCQGWMSGFMPLYLRTMYGNDPHFSDAKVIYTPYNENIDEKFAGNILPKLNFDSISNEDADVLATPNVVNLNKLGAKWADAISHGSEVLNEELVSYMDSLDKPKLGYQSEDTIVEAYQEFYDLVQSTEDIMAE